MIFGEKVKERFFVFKFKRVETMVVGVALGLQDAVMKLSIVCLVFFSTVLMMEL